MSDDQLRLTRQDLYELAWSKPMVDLARDFGISDVALAKRCRNLRIPVPGRGYWARVSAGQTPRRPPLPEHKPLWRDQHALTVQSPPQDVLGGSSDSDDAVAAVEHTLAQLDTLSVNPSLDLCAATAAVRRTALAHKHSGRHELSFARGEKAGPILALQVTAGVLSRALLFADTLLRTAESLGWRFVESLPEGRNSHDLDGGEPSDSTRSSSRIGQLLVNGERISFRIEERLIDELRELTPAGRRQRATQVDQKGRVDPRSTGALRLVRVDRDSWSVHRKSWYDRRGRQLEGQIPEILRGFFELAREIRARRIEAERRRREREEEERRRRELEERREANASLVEALEIQAGAWLRAWYLRAYLRAARRAVPEGLTVECLGQRIDFMQWAEEYVNGLDPLHEQPRAQEMLPERYSWAGSSNLKDGLSRLFGQEWPKSWKHSSRQGSQEVADDDLE